MVSVRFIASNTFFLSTLISHCVVEVFRMECVKSHVLHARAYILILNGRFSTCIRIDWAMTNKNMESTFV